jgi:hypothetical protein
MDDKSMINALIIWIISDCKRCPLHNEKGNCMRFGCDIECEQAVKTEIEYRISHKAGEQP